MTQEPFRSFGLLEVTRILPCIPLRGWLSGFAPGGFSAEGPRRVGGSQFRLRDSPASQCKVAAKGSASGSSTGQ